MIKFQWYQFTELSPAQLYTVLALRGEVFVVEQACRYLDPDGKDMRALHLLGVENDELLAYTRLFPPTQTENFLVFGRVATAKSARRKGYGKKLIQTLLQYCDEHFPGIPIKCSAQHYLLAFYQRFGFKAYGEVYQEENIPHIAMERQA